MRITVTIDIAPDAPHPAPSEDILMTTVADIKAELASQTTIIGSLKSLISGLVAAVEANKTDPTALDDILAQIKANDAELAAATVTNTPAAEAPAAAPAETFPATDAPAPATDAPADQPAG